jgi:KUP system potassium uptake protein
MTIGRRDRPPSGSARARIPLMLAALGVVCGDIGTSPLYAIRECFGPQSLHPVEPTPENVLGVLSLVFWSLTMVISIKYLTFIMRADNQGRGGVLALLALLPPRGDKNDGRPVLLLLALFGASLLYGDSAIMPAISVLSAVEGLEGAAHSLKPAIVPLTCGILIGLFSVQKHGTGRVGAMFGPFMLLWFLIIAALGAAAIAQNPGVLRAVSPAHAFQFFAHNQWRGFLILGSVALCVTGGEALYADMGHFGRRPIRAVWFTVVLPALLLNYFGQGAILLRDPSAAKSPFYALVPAWALYPVIAVATMATVIASQAIISGAFSLTQQAVQLGFLPRMDIVHTSKEAEGQIYIPQVSWALLVACLALVLVFRSSSGLAAAYGIAVTGTMTVTTILFYVVVTERWGWARRDAAALVCLFLVFDLGYFAANLAKLQDGWGGATSLVMGVAVFIVMTTWKKGRALLYSLLEERALPLGAFLEDLGAHPLLRVSGTAVLMSPHPGVTPVVLLHHVKHNRALHEQVVLLCLEGERVPEVPPERQISVEYMGQGFFQVLARHGFMQTPNVPSVMEACRQHGITHAPGSTSYYLDRNTLLTTGKTSMARWQKALFVFLSRNAPSATAYFGLPPNRVVELGMQVDL